MSTSMLKPSVDDAHAIAAGAAAVPRSLVEGPVHDLASYIAATDQPSHGLFAVVAAIIDEVRQVHEVAAEHLGDLWLP